MDRSRFAALALASLALVLTAGASHAPPNFIMEAVTDWTAADFGTSIGTLQGVAHDGTSYYVSSTSALAKYDRSGNQAWLKDTSTDGSQGGAAQTDVAYYAGNLYVGHKTSSTGYIGIYSASSGAFQGEATLGAGTPSAITHAHGSFWIIWTTDGTSYEVQERDAAFNLVASYPLPRTYELDTGPQGAAWVDAALLLPRHAKDGQQHGIDVFRLTPTHATPGFEYVHTMPYVSWTTPDGRQEVSSQGIDVLRDHRRYSIVAVGRDAATGNGGGTGGVLHAKLAVDRDQSYNVNLFGVTVPPAQIVRLTNGTLQGVAHADGATFVSTTDALLRLDSTGAVTASRDTTADGHASQNGDLTVLGGVVYVHTSDFPATPRQAYIAAYNASSLAFIEEKPVGNRDGAGGGVTTWNGSLLAPVNRDLGGALALRVIDPTTLSVVEEIELGNYGSISPQGIATLGNLAVIPHGNKHSLDSPDGWLIFAYDGTTWSYEGSHPYPGWTGGDGFDQWATQGLDFDVDAECSVTAWAVGRYYDGHGHGSGEIARFDVTLGSLDPCPDGNPPGDDPPPNDDPPGSGGVDLESFPWLLTGLGTAAVLLIGLAAWSLAKKPAAPNAPSDKALVLSVAAVVLVAATALAAWPQLSTLWT